MLFFYNVLNFKALTGAKSWPESPKEHFIYELFPVSYVLYFQINK